jgi:hypothetical protein
MLRRAGDDAYAPISRADRLERFLATDWRGGSVYDLAARFGLRFRGVAPKLRALFTPADMKESAQRRNVRLRVLHGGVDVEPSDMEAAKAALLDRKEKEHAAQEIRAARRRMSEELTKE